MSDRTSRVALVQMRCGAEPDRNFAHAVGFIREAAKQGAQIVCLPELFRSHYFCQSEDHKNFELAEEIPGRSTSALGEIARETGVVIIASLFEKRSAGVYHNTAVIIDGDGKLLGKYRKMHIPDDPLYHEKFYFTPGDLGFQAWKTKRGNIGVCVCWDQWYPEAARLTVLRGAEILFYPTAIGWHPSEKRNSARLNILPGKQFSAATPSPMVATLRWRIASDMKRPRVATESSSGDKALLRHRVAKSLPRVRWMEKKLSWPMWNGIA